MKKRCIKLSDCIVEITSSIISSIKKMDYNAKGIVYVISNEILVGTVTDGDVRRYIMQDGNVQEPVDVVMNKNPIFLSIGEEKYAREIMCKKSIRSIPILDENKRIVKIIFEDYLVEDCPSLNVPVVIMAGGKGTRLYPYTQILPKPLIPIGSQTITEHIMERFMRFDCNTFLMIVNYKKNFIKAFFDDHEKRDLVTFVEEEEFCGTGGGLKLLEGMFNSTFFMTNCDILIEADYSDIIKCHKEHDNMVTMVCAKKNMIIPYGTVKVSTEGQVTKLLEKPQLSFITNTGFYVLEPSFIKEIPDNTYIHITDVIQKCIDAGKKIGVYIIDEDKWLDMGQMDELEKMKKKMSIE